jgi:hypothetical protein
MNTDLLADRIHDALNKELIKRLLVRYFTSKGFDENFNKKIHPPMLQDMLIHVPQLVGKIDIAPYVEDIDPNTGVVRLGWNLFVLGNRRMYLGESTHASLIEVRMAVGGPLDGSSHHIHAATPKRIIEFVINILSNSKSGDITNVPKSAILRTPSMVMNNDAGGFFRTRNRPVW